MMYNNQSMFEFFKEYMKDDLTTVKAAEGRISECPEEVECFIKLLSLLYATTETSGHKEMISWCLNEMSYTATFEEEIRTQVRSGIKAKRVCHC